MHKKMKYYCYMENMKKNISANQSCTNQRINRNPITAAFIFDNGEIVPWKISIHSRNDLLSLRIDKHVTGRVLSDD